MKDKDPLAEFLRVKEDARQRQAEADRLDGAVGQLERRLAAFGCETLEDAEQEKKTAEKELKAAEKELVKGIEAYDAKWNER